MPTTLEQIQYGFDRDSRRTWKSRTLTTNEDDYYSYDALSQVTVAARGNLNLNLTAISGRPVSEQSWNYDPTGNWRGFDAAENGNLILDQHRVHDRGNRLTQIEDSPTAMVLDRVGRMRQAAPDAEGDRNGKLELTWDAWSRVTSVKSNGATVGEYQYDGLTRRTTREVLGVTWHSYYSDAWRPLEERKNSESTAAISYLWGARHRDDLVRRDRAVGGTTLNETRYVLMDYFNAAAITDAAGVVKERYAYNAFGIRSILNPDYSVRSSSECAFEFGFQGQFLDAESGLMNYGYRLYSPYLGRWMCKDPIWEIGGVNLYSMVENRTPNRIDLLGLSDRALPDIKWKEPDPFDHPSRLPPIPSPPTEQRFFLHYECRVVYKIKPQNGAKGCPVQQAYVGIGDTERAACDDAESKAIKEYPNDPCADCILDELQGEPILKKVYRTINLPPGMKAA
jgi:RHS repeat-associated protein